MGKQSNDSVSGTLNSLMRNIKRLGLLYVEKARLKTTEKLTILLSTIAFTAIMMALAIVFIVFITIGIGHLLATSIAPHMAYLYVACFYLLIILLVVLLRRKIFIDPIARFMSRLLVEAPEEESDDESEEPRPASPPHENVDVVTPEIDYDKLARHVVEILQQDAVNRRPDDIEESIEEDFDEEGGER